MPFTNKAVLCRDFNSHNKWWKNNGLNNADKVILDLLNLNKLELLFNDTDIPIYLHYNGNGTNTDLTSAIWDISEDASREIIYDPGLRHRIIFRDEISFQYIHLKKLLKIGGTSKRPTGWNSQVNLTVFFVPPMDSLFQTKALIKFLKVNKIFFFFLC